MGSRIDAFIEYDDRHIRNPKRSNQEPFSEVTDCVIPLNDYLNLWAGHDYKFFAAISGIRNDTTIKPLYPPRGLPPNVCPQTYRAIDQFYEPVGPGIGWLTLEEIEASLQHMNIKHEDLSLAVQLVMELMGCLEKRLGKNRTRLVFAIE